MIILSDIVSIFIPVRRENGKSSLKCDIGVIFGE